jgi:hypothetical protein
MLVSPLWFEPLPPGQRYCDPLLAKCASKRASYLNQQCNTRCRSVLPAQIPASSDRLHSYQEQEWEPTAQTSSVPRLAKQSVRVQIRWFRSSVVVYYDVYKRNAQVPRLGCNYSYTPVYQNAHKFSFKTVGGLGDAYPSCGPKCHRHFPFVARS